MTRTIRPGSACSERRLNSRTRARSTADMAPYYSAAVARRALAHVGLGQRRRHDLDDRVAAALQGAYLAHCFLEGRISDADSLTRRLLDPNHVLADDVFCHGGTYGPSGGGLHVRSPNGARLVQLSNETPKRRKSVQLWTTTV